mmetsp:Transcript_40148/g.102763  ORF Transcript_40148/g.102763 Transcript_40148/m.102763 type:complete len:202 (-) Transcript_40148:68-673(-)
MLANAVDCRQRMCGKLQLVDLAGSERIGKMDASQPERLKETMAINKSLSALGDVLSALGTKAAHIPFRNSKLTYALQDSLCPGAKVLMLLALSPAPASVKESVNTLSFGMRMRSVELGTAQVYVDATNGMFADIKTDGSPIRRSPLKQAGTPLQSPRSPGLSPITKDAGSAHHVRPSRGSRMYAKSPVSSPMKAAAHRGRS